MRRARSRSARPDLHETAEQLAVPSFDWMTGPMVAIVDGFLHIDPDAPLPHSDTPVPEARAATAGVPPDDAAYNASRLLAGLARKHS